MFSTDKIISVKYVDNHTAPKPGVLVNATDKNTISEHETHRIRQARSKTSSLAVVDFELRYKLTEVMAEKQTEKRSHGSFAIIVSTGC